MTELPSGDVAALIDKEAIRDTIYGYAQAVDRWDRDLYASFFTPDAVLHLGVYDGPAAVMFGKARASSLLGTHHALSNIRIRLDGNRAKAITYISAVHRKLHDGQLVDELFRARYLDVLERREGRWLIAERTSIRDWSHVRPAHDTELPPADGAEIIPGKDGQADPGFGFLD